MLKKVVFLDRDGTVNQDSDAYIKNWSEFTFLPRSLEALSDLNAAGYTIIVITNQSALPRKLITLTELERIHSELKAAVERKGGNICDIFFCPHMPQDGCDCRKPSPGLIIQAQIKYQIDLAASIMVGDSARDIECAHNAGCGRSILVKTGNYQQAQSDLIAVHLKADYVAADLYDAANWILASEP